MDNQFYPPNGGYPQGGQPPYGQQPAPDAQPMQGYETQPMQGYAPQGQPMPNPYEASYGVQPEGAYPQQGTYNPYDLQQAGYAAYTQAQQPQQDPYQTGYQQPYGGVQQPYAEAGYQYHFDHTQSVMQQPPTGFPPQ